MRIISYKMSAYRLDILGDLAGQMRFTPHQTRAAQLDAAESLLFEIDPAKAYPADYITFKITGYHPKQATTDLLTGLALQHDLGLLIERVSDSLDVRLDQQSIPVLGIDDVSERFNVTSKTIQRWRRKGLPARRFVYADGKRRIGFLLTSVERFFSINRDQVKGGANLSEVDDTERNLILRHARRLAIDCRCTESEISRRIARRFNRSPVTVLHTIRRHDESNPDQAVFTHAPPELSTEQRGRILRGYRRGLSLAVLARKFDRPRSAIHRALLEGRAESLSLKKIHFIDDPLLHGRDAEAAIDAIIGQEAIVSSDQRSADESRIPRSLPPYLAALYRTPLLSPSRERGLFLQLNYRKYQFIHTRRKLDPQFARARDLAMLENLLHRIQETRNRLIQANLRLVVSVARKHLRPNLDLMELVSEGNITLMRAVDGFDVGKGNRFSTYATLALMKGFARSVPQMTAGDGAIAVEPEVLGALADPTVASEHGPMMARDELGNLLVHLDTRERDVLLAHWGVGRDEAGYDDLARRFNLSRQRIRQIEKSAIDKLRSAANLPLST